jgi:hypothetical protein
MKIIGLLPASGSASRLGGIPKFCLPIEDQYTLLEWHVWNMQEVCDEIRISTRRSWLPIVENMKFPKKVSIVPIEPSTMSDAVVKLQGSDSARFLVGMPDTIIRDTTKNHYLELAHSQTELKLALWKCTEELKGRVGQIEINSSGTVVGSADKNPECTFDFMWGAFSFSNTLFNQSLSHPGLQFQELIESNHEISTTVCDGEYVDLGKFSGLLDFYGKYLSKTIIFPTKS